MPRKNFSPKNFELDVDHPWTMAIHTNDMIVLNPQLDLEHPGDLDTQTTVSIGHIRKLMADIGGTMSDITNIRVEYVNAGNVDEDAYRRSIIDQLGDVSDITIEMVPFDRLVLPELLVEICTYAQASQSGGSFPRTTANPDGLFSSGSPVSHGIKCKDLLYVGEQSPRDRNGEVQAPGNFKEQSERVVNQIETVLRALDADLDDIVRLNFFYDAGISENDRSAFCEFLAARFSGSPAPALTAIPLPRLYPDGVTIVGSAWAMRGEDGRKLRKRCAVPDGSGSKRIDRLWRHGIECEDMVFIGGQGSISPDGGLLFPGDHIAQTKRTMEAIEELLTEFDQPLQNVHKINSYYVLSTVEEFNSNLETRSAYFKKPGPGSVGLPLDVLSTDGQCIEVEAILVKE